jgi:putative membrane protein
MSSMSSVAGLSKYITTLPKTEKSITAMFIISFISGAVYFIINPSPELGMVENIILGGLFSLIILGISSIIGGGVNQQIVSGLHGINLKIKHSMFLSALSMTIVCILLISFVF